MDKPCPATRATSARPLIQWRPAKAATTISIPIAADGLVERSETFTVTVTADDTKWSVDSNRGNSATITITDQDRETAAITFGNSAASTTKYAVTVAEDVTGGTLNVPVTVNHLPGAATTFAVEVLSSTGTAGEGSDFSIAAKSVTFGPNTARTQNVAITLTDDGDYENDETIELRIRRGGRPRQRPGRPLRPERRRRHRRHHHRRR